MLNSLGGNLATAAVLQSKEKNLNVDPVSFRGLFMSPKKKSVYFARTSLHKYGAMSSQKF